MRSTHATFRCYTGARERERALRSFLIGGVTIAFMLAGAPAFADPLGVWRDSDGTTIRVQRCGTALCGTIVGMSPPNDPETGQPWTDKFNSEQTKRGDPLIGRQVFIDMQPAGPGKWSGTLYNTDDGRSLRRDPLWRRESQPRALKRGSPKKSRRSTTGG